MTVSPSARRVRPALDRGAELARAAAATSVPTSSTPAVVYVPQSMLHRRSRSARYAGRPAVTVERRAPARLRRRWRPERSRGHGPTVWPVAILGDRAPGRNPPARGTQPLPAGAGGQARGRRSAGGGRWYGQRDPAAVRAGPASGRRCPRPTSPGESLHVAAWVRRLRRAAPRRRRGAGDRPPHERPGHWIVAWPWRGTTGRARSPTAALALAERDVPVEAPLRWPAPAANVDRVVARVREPSGARPAGSATPSGGCRSSAISGTNGKTTTTRMISHILRQAGRRVGTTTTDGVLVDERARRAGRLHRAGRRAAVLERTTWTWRCSRRRAAGSCCAAWATSRTTRAS